MRFDQHREAEAHRHRFQLAHASQIERRHDQQNAIGTRRARFINLIRVNHEIFTQHRQRAGGARRFHMFDIALKKLLIRQHRQARRAVLLVTFCDQRGFKCFTQHAFAGAGLFDFSNDRGFSRRDFCAQCAGKITRRQCRVGVPLYIGQRRGKLGSGDLRLFNRNDTP